MPNLEHPSVEFARIYRQLEPVWERNRGIISPLLPDRRDLCQVCTPWRIRLATYPRNESDPLMHESIGALDSMFARHRSAIHGPIKKVPLAMLSRFINPTVRLVDGKVSYYEPEETLGNPEYSKAFFLLNRHRIGRIQIAQMKDMGRESRDPKSKYLLTLSDRENRRLVFGGCRSGFGGESPRATLFILRLSGYTEIVPSKKGEMTELERTVFTHRSFCLLQ